MTGFWLRFGPTDHGAFAGVIIESVIVPIPSPLIIMGAGFVLIHPNLSFLQALAPLTLQIVLPGAVASTLGAYIGYGIGYVGGKPMVDRWEKFLGFSWRDVEALERRFHGGRVHASIFLLRALPIHLSALGHLGGSGLAALAARTVYALDFLRRGPALSFSRLSRLGLGRNLSINRAGHRPRRNYFFRSTRSRNPGGNRLAARAGQRKNP